MKGKHRVIIEAERLKYEFEIKRNVTVIQGDSATGKTTLVDLIQTYGRYGQESGIMMASDVPCVAFTGDASLWKTVLDAYKDSIIFLMRIILLYSRKILLRQYGILQITM